MYVLSHVRQTTSKEQRNELIVQTVYHLNIAHRIKEAGNAITRLQPQT
jgi:hypothetical protein